MILVKLDRISFNLRLKAGIRPCHTGLQQQNKTKLANVGKKTFKRFLIHFYIEKI